MRNLIMFALLLFTTGLEAQIIGNGNMVTKDIPVKSFKSIDIGLYAEYEIDMDKEPSLSITIDENLIQYVDKEVRNGILHVDQLEWIQSKMPVYIKIGGKGITKLKQTSHSKTNLRNIDQPSLTIDAEVGNIILDGRVRELMVKVNTATVNAEDLSAETANLTFESWGTIRTNVSGDVKVKNEENGKLFLNGKTVGKQQESYDEPVRFIEFVLKNNSGNRHQFYVVGPKPDGSSFSYGFPMMPNQKRDKNWTNGTKVYKVNNLGMRKLVKTISLEDEGKTVDIFEK